jgi:hypothetical protein
MLRKTWKFKGEKVYFSSCQKLKNFGKTFFRQKIKTENDTLKNHLKLAQDDVAKLLEDKRTLMDTIKSLQVSFKIS